VLDRPSCAIQSSSSIDKQQQGKEIDCNRVVFVGVGWIGVCVRARARWMTLRCVGPAVHAHTHILSHGQDGYNRISVCVSWCACTHVNLSSSSSSALKERAWDESVGVGGTVPTDRPVVGVVQSAHCVIFGVC
jgi:hypothetical protein